ncbi:MAG TPA: orc1/cdc6 family replication initiation protein [Candidatus Nanoarchaeia archaeon]|nr:orc1/cdc6 family replication initiation protein [Candidatus Nanoarchaeia archaeon]
MEEKNGGTAGIWQNDQSNSPGLDEFFDDFLKAEPLFLDKLSLQPNYLPEQVQHRGKEIHELAQILAPVLRQQKPSNLFIYGKTGTGKTLSVLHTIDKIKNLAKSKNIPVTTLYLNCKLKKIADTEYRLIAQLARDCGQEIPATGLPTDEVYKSFFSVLDSKKQVVLLILDEIDQLVKKTGDEILYNLTRVNTELKNAQTSIIGISNDIMFANNLDPRVKSSLSEEEIIFAPYNALQIQDILRQRAVLAFKEGTLEDGIIEKCAAYAAREHGDARRAIELLRVAAEVAERKNERIVRISHLDDAEHKIEKERIVDIVKNQPKQFQATLYSILMISEPKSGQLFTGDVYDSYLQICKRTGLRPLTQRRVSDIIGELDMLGIITAKVMSKGRQGRTRIFSLPLQDETLNQVKSLLKKDLGMD